MVSDEIARNMDAVRHIATEVLSGSEESVVQAERLHELAFELEESIGGFNLDGSKLAARRARAPAQAASAATPKRALPARRRRAKPATAQPTRRRARATDAWRSPPDIVAGVVAAARRARRARAARRGSSRRAPRRGSPRSASRPTAYVELIDSGARRRRARARWSRRCASARASLFRHKPQIAALADVVVPALRARGQRAIRVWSAGCAAGEEPYTLAIVLSRALPDCAMSILATDVSSRRARGRAQRATLSARRARRRARRVSRRVRSSTATRCASRPELARLRHASSARTSLDGAAPRGLRHRVVPQRADLLHAPRRARRAIERLVAATAPGGFVFVGYSESLRDVAELEARRAGDAVYYVRARRRRAHDAGRRRPEVLARIARRCRRRRSCPKASKHALVVPPVGPAAAPRRDVLVLAGTPTAPALTAQIGERLSRSAGCAG